MLRALLACMLLSLVQHIACAPIPYDGFFDEKNELPPFLRDPLVGVIGETCYVSLVEDFHVTDVSCLKYAASKVLGLGIVFGSAVIKVPQMITILTRRSVKGLSLTSYYLETYAYIIILAYNIRQQNPFSTYGEVVFIASQNVLITLMILWYGRPAGTAQLDAPMAWTLAVNFVAFVASFWVLLLPTWVPFWLLAFLYASTIPIILASKVPQIYSNYKYQSTGQLSVFAVFNYFAGTTARVFTTLTELDDPLMLAGNVFASVLNGVLVFQVYRYWQRPIEPSVSPTDGGSKAD